MKRNSFLLLATLVASMAIHAAADEVIYATGFEPPTFTAGLPVRGQDGWQMLFNGAGLSVSTENPREGTQCLRFEGATLTPLTSGFSLARCLRSVADATATKPALIVEIRADVRLDGPQTGTLGTPDQDIISANLIAVASLPFGRSIFLGGFFVSSSGKIWTYSNSTLPGDNYKYSVPNALRAYHTLRLRVDFIARKLTYFVDGAELGSVPINPNALSDQLASAILDVYGPTAPINTPDLAYDRANYVAYFDNFSITSIPVTPANVAIQFPLTDYASQESAGTASVTVERRGYTDSAVRATLTTADGTATARRDYAPVSTLVAFAPGETQKVVQIPIRNDRTPEADETVVLSLSGATPGVAIPRSMVPLWILDDDRAGSVDLSFHFNADALGLNPVYEAPSIMTLPGGRFLAAVFGADQSGNYAGMLARFRADGSPDLEFTPYPLPYSVGFPSQVTPVKDSRRVLVNLGDRVVRLSARGQEDPAFGVSTSFGPDPGFITDVLVQPDGKVILAGWFDSVNGVPRHNIARVRPNGAVDESFDPGDGPDDAVLDAAVQPDGRVVICGYFLSVSGVPRPFLARLNENGALDSSFDPGESFAGPPFLFPDVHTLALQRDGKILVGGSFVGYQGVPRVCLARLMPNGTLDPTFDIGTGFEAAFSPGTPGFVNGLAVRPDGKVLVAGGFGNVNGLWATGIVRLNPDGSRDPEFQLGATETFSAGVNSGPALALLPNGDILCYLVNNFSFIRNQPVSYQGILRLNGDARERAESDED